jgi:hypothetical protein
MGTCKYIPGLDFVVMTYDTAVYAATTLAMTKKAARKRVREPVCGS